MTGVFADTSFYVALSSDRDACHGAAMDFSAGYRGGIVTTEYILVELGNFFSRAGDRKVFLDLMDDLRSDPKTCVVPSGTKLFNDGLRLYAARQDKDWSLTDCISFVVMHKHGLTEALTGDRHFEQAGLRALLA